MNSFKRSSIADQVERMEIGVRKVVRSTSSTLRPSIPSEYSMLIPANWNHGRRSIIWIAPLPLSKRVSMMIETPKVTREASNATQRIAGLRSLGRNRITRTPSKGEKVNQVSREVDRFIRCPQPI